MRKKMKKPPKLGQWLLRWLSDQGNSHSLLGDMEENYRDIQIENGSFNAIFWYWLQLIISFPVFFGQTIIWSFTMLGNYIKIAVRNLLKYKVYSFINIVGLSVGLASFILIYLYIADEFSFDRFHRNADSIYRIANSWMESDGSVDHISSSLPA